MRAKYDFCGWATRNDLRCSDGRTIRRDAFKVNDGKKVPIVWNHDHNDPSNVLGHGILENRKEGVYVYGYLNDTDRALDAKAALDHGDIESLSIWANGLKQVSNGNGIDVIHGDIKEVSLVLAGANPGALIENVIMAHGEESDEEAVIYTGEPIELMHAESEPEEKEEEKEEMAEEAKKDKTVGDVLETLNEEQKAVVYALIGEALNSKGGKSEEDNDEEEKEEMKHNAFDDETKAVGDTLSHSELATILADGKRYGSLKESFLAHAQEYGIENIDYLFPDAKLVGDMPEMIKRDTDWVSKVVSAAKHTPFSRVKSILANITEDEARARGYIKGNFKKEEVIKLLKRSTEPQTIYKKQKLDRDDVTDITDFNVVAWLKTEMRMMLDEEIARAALLGDGRSAADEDKISEDHIRPIATDADLYSVKIEVEHDNNDSYAVPIIDAAIRNRKLYKGSGNPTFFTTEDVLADMLLIKDQIGHYMYENVSALATRLRVKEIVTVPVMDGDLLGIMVNMSDYTFGADKGGAINMFDDFDIDYNQQKYLIETRCSGALVKPYSALVFKMSNK